jgi:hypothetical protein
MAPDHRCIALAKVQWQVKNDINSPIFQKLTFGASDVFEKQICYKSGAMTASAARVREMICLQAGRLKRKESSQRKLKKNWCGVRCFD